MENNKENRNLDDNQEWLDELLNTPTPVPEIGPDEHAVHSAGLSHPEDMELEKILAEDWLREVEELPEEEADQPAVQEEANMPEEAVALENPGESPSASDTNATDSSPLTHKELVLLGLALSANNMGIGIGASMAGIPLMAASVFTFLCSVCFLHMGNVLGSRLGQLKFLRLADRFADPLSGLLLILLGICQLL